MERKWMVLKLDTDGVVILSSFEFMEDAYRHIRGQLVSNKFMWAVKYGYPWET